MKCNALIAVEGLGACTYVPFCRLNFFILQEEFKNEIKNFTLVI